MATHNTITVTITDGSSMTEAEAGQIATALAAMIVKKCRGDVRVTSCTPIYTTDTTTITVA